MSQRARERGRGWGGVDYQRTLARITLRNFTLKTRHTHTFARCTVGIGEGKREKNGQCGTSILSDLSPSSLIFSALSVKGCPFPSLSAGNCRFNKMPGQSARRCCERQTWQRGVDQTASSPVRHPAKSNRGHLVKAIIGFSIISTQSLDIIESFPAEAFFFFRGQI